MASVTMSVTATQTRRMHAGQSMARRIRGGFRISGFECWNKRKEMTKVQTTINVNRSTSVRQRQRDIGPWPWSLGVENDGAAVGG